MFRRRCRCTDVGVTFVETYLVYNEFARGAPALPVVPAFSRTVRMATRTPKFNRLCPKWSKTDKSTKPTNFSLLILFSSTLWHQNHSQGRIHLDKTRIRSEVMSNIWWTRQATVLCQKYSATNDVPINSSAFPQILETFLCLNQSKSFH